MIKSALTILYNLVANTRIPVENILELQDLSIEFSHAQKIPVQKEMNDRPLYFWSFKALIN